MSESCCGLRPASLSPIAEIIDRKARKGRKGAAAAVGDGPPAAGRRLTPASSDPENACAQRSGPHAFPGSEPAGARRGATPVADRCGGSLTACRVRNPSRPLRSLRSIVPALRPLRALRSIVVPCVVLALAISAPALAQGKSQLHKKSGSGPKPPSRYDLVVPTVVSSSGGAPMACLDDASLLDPGGVSV